MTWTTQAPVQLAHGCTVDSHCGGYYVTSPGGELIADISAGYYQTRRAVLAEARDAVARWKTEHQDCIECLGPCDDVRDSLGTCGSDRCRRRAMQAQSQEYGGGE